jgi:uncharacterized membrane protein
VVGLPVIVIAWADLSVIKRPAPDQWTLLQVLVIVFVVGLVALLAGLRSAYRRRDDS